MDGLVNISGVTDSVFTNVINTLSSVKFIGTVISNKQFTGLLTKVLNEGGEKIYMYEQLLHDVSLLLGTNIKQLTLHCVSLPRVHPNILGPGLAQFPVLDISGSVMAEQQRGTLFFSILDTRLEDL